jgi:hypothetical protein
MPQPSSECLTLHRTYLYTSNTNKLLLLGEIMTTIKAFPVGQQHSYPKIYIYIYILLNSLTYNPAKYFTSF